MVEEEEDRKRDRDRKRGGEILKHIRAFFCPPPPPPHSTSGNFSDNDTESVGVVERAMPPQPLEGSSSPLSPRQHRTLCPSFMSLLTKKCLFAQSQGPSSSFSLVMPLVLGVDVMETGLYRARNAHTSTEIEREKEKHHGSPMHTHTHTHTLFHANNLKNARIGKALP